MSEFGKLDEITVENYKSIKKLQIKLNNLNVLLGQNGAGKSNFISFFKLMNKILNKDLQLYSAQQGVDRLLYFGKKKSDHLSFYLKFKPNAYEATLVPSTDGHLIFKSELAYFYASEIGYNGGVKIDSLAKAGSLESSLPDPSNHSIAGHVSKYVDDWKVYHFHDTSETAAVKSVCDINDNERLRPNAENLAAFLFSIKETDEYQKIINTISRVAPFFQDFILQPDKLNNEKIRLRWKHKGSDDYFDAHSLSDGTIRFICLATLLMQPSLPTMILLDEPELGLHPFANQLLAGMLKSAAASTQVIVSTQSVTLANEMSWEDIVVVEQTEKGSVFKRLKEQEVKLWLESYEIGDIWQKNLIGGVPSC